MLEAFDKHERRASGKRFRLDHGRQGDGLLHVRFGHVAARYDPEDVAADLGESLFDRYAQDW